MLYLTQLPQALIFLAIFIWIGYFFLELRVNKFTLANIPFYFIIGLVFSSILDLVLSALNLPFFFIFILLLLLSLIKIKALELNIYWNKSYLVVITFCLLSLVVLASTSFFEGFNPKNELILYQANVHDGLWHIALEESIVQALPSINPIYSGEPVNGYHYLYDVGLVLSSKISGLSIIDLYLKWFPVILAIMLASTAYLFFRELVKNKTLSLMYAILLILTSGFAYLAPLLYSGATNNQSVFWLDQPVRYLINQQLVLSLIIINIIMTLFIRDFRKYWVVIGLLIGSLAGIKVYGFIIFFSAFLILSSWQFIVKRNYIYIYASLLSLVVSAIIIYISKPGSGNPFFLDIGWFISTMFQATDRLNYSTWEIHRQLFMDHRNYPRLILQWSYGLGIFLFGNLGLKVAFPFLLSIKRKQIKEFTSISIISLVMLILSVTLPLLFLQKGGVWNTIQFLHYAQLPLAICIYLVLKNLSLKRQKVIILILILIGLPTTIQELSKNFNFDNYTVYNSNLVTDFKRIAELNLIGNIYVENDLNNNSLVSALIKKPVYYADPSQLSVLRVDYLTREQDSNNPLLVTKLCPIGSNIISSKNRNTVQTNLIYSGIELQVYHCY